MHLLTQTVFSMSSSRPVSLTEPKQKSFSDTVKIIFISFHRRSLDYNGPRCRSDALILPPLKFHSLRIIRSDPATKISLGLNPTLWQAFRLEFFPFLSELPYHNSNIYYNPFFRPPGSLYNSLFSPLLRSLPHYWIDQLPVLSSSSPTNRTLSSQTFP